MNKETDLLYVVLALQMSFITREQLVECGALWATNRKKSLKTILNENGHLKPATRAALEAMVKAQVEEFGTAEKSLAALPMDEDLKRSLLGLPPGEKVNGTLMELKARPPAGTLLEVMAAPPVELSSGEALRGAPSDADSARTVVSGKAASTVSPRSAKGARECPEDKYEFGRELGRGGLGKVIEAMDADFGREVAVKMMLPGEHSPETVDRFFLEGRVAGKLPHPNIVPVYEIGAIRAEGQDAPYFTMARILGRDLGKVLESVQRGEGDTRTVFRRPRLLRIFQDVCNAMAYAHDHGVIHRDLKPANVMVGEYGEVYVVDWGLAKVKSVEKTIPGSITKFLMGSQETPQLTMDGQVMGTPAYMPPEQADGRVQEVDERSDIYSLGAILYEILTLHPPFEGETSYNVIAKVLMEEPKPPSQKVDEIRREGEGAKWMEPVPPDLDEVCLKALSKDKAKRFMNAKVVHDEVQKFLEGEKERERNHERALAKVVEGKILVEKMEKLRADLRAAEKEAEEKEKEVKPFWPVEKKEGVWTLQDRVKTLRDEVVKTYTAAQGAFQEALGFERKNPEARAALADLYWDQYSREEAAGGRAEMVLYEGLVRQYNDGHYDAKLKGDGTLTISTQFYPCKCLAEGRTIKPDEMGVMAYHPFSGRSLDGRKGAEGLPDLEPKEPIRLNVHGSDCNTQRLEGADVWLFRFEERKRILVPVFPEGVIAGGAVRNVVPSAILDRCFDPGSPFRPKEGLRLGKTPVDRFAIPMGSYLLLIARAGFHPVRCPVSIARNGEESVDVTLYRDGEIPAGFIQVPAGKFIYQGDKENPYSGPEEIKETTDFFMARFPITCREYLAFLNDLAVRSPEGAALRIPRESEKAGPYWPKGPDGNYVIPTTGWLAKAPEDLKKHARKLASTSVDWEEDWPVFGVSWEDAMAFAAWFSRKHGLQASLSDEVMWEKAARGADGRYFPFGNYFDNTYANANGSHEGPNLPRLVDSFPVDESPCGVRGLGGNSADWCIDDVEDGQRRLQRGGSWLGTGFDNRSTARRADPPASIGHGSGFRLCVQFSVSTSKGRPELLSGMDGNVPV